MFRFAFHALVAGLGVYLASALMEGIHYDTPLTLVVVAILLALLNAVLRPILVLFTLPFVMLTLGLGLFVINAALLGLTAWLVPGFTIASVGAALWGTLIISLLAWAAHLLLGRRKVGAALRVQPPAGGRNIIDV